jgi:hypothetical protein
MKRKDDKTVHIICHLSYVADLKLYASTEHKPILLPSLTEAFSNDIKMSFGDDKSKTQSMRKDKHQID